MTIIFEAKTPDGQYKYTFRHDAFPSPRCYWLCGETVVEAVPPVIMQKLFKSKRAKEILEQLMRPVSLNTAATPAAPEDLEERANRELLHRRFRSL